MVAFKCRRVLNVPVKSNEVAPLDNWLIWTSIVESVRLA